MHEGEGLFEQLGAGDEVGVEDHEELALGDRQGVVDVAGLRPVVGQPAHVAALEFSGQVAHVVGVAVVQQPRLVRAADAERRLGRPPDHLHRFAVHRDQHVDGGGSAVQVERVGRRGLGRGVVPVELAARGVEREAAGVALPGEDGPHGHEGVEDEDDLGDDDQRPGEHVTAVGRVEQEPAVRQDAERRHDRRDQHDGGVRVARGRPPGLGAVPDGGQRGGARRGGCGGCAGCGNDGWGRRHEDSRGWVRAGGPAGAGVRPRARGEARPWWGGGRLIRLFVRSTITRYREMRKPRGRFVAAGGPGGRRCQVGLRTPYRT